MLESHIEVGDRLSLDPLGSIYDQESTFTGSDGAGDLIGEVHVSWGVDEVEDVGLSIQLIVHLDSVAFDRDTTLTL